MYVARLGATFIVKRMPGTATSHATTCRSHEATGAMAALASTATRATLASTPSQQLELTEPATDVRHERSSRTELADLPPTARVLTLRGLLDFLWDRAGLSRWKSTRVARQSWSTVRRLLLSATQGKAVNGQDLAKTLYIPEAFYPERRDAIAARRVAHWAQSETGSPVDQSRPSFRLLIGELKRVTPCSSGHVAVVKHVPDQPFMLQEETYLRLVRRLGPALSHWQASDRRRTIVIARLAVEQDGTSMIEDLALMSTDLCWVSV